MSRGAAIRILIRRSYSSSSIGDSGSSAVEVLVAALKDAIDARNVASGRKIHAGAIESGAISNIFVATTVMDMYGRVGGTVDDAQRVFDAMEQRSVVSWAVMIAGYARQGREEMALELLERMEEEGFEPHRAAYLAALKACTGLAAKEEAKNIAGKMVKLAALERVKKIDRRARRERTRDGDTTRNDGGDGSSFDDDAVMNCLIDVYAKCGSMVDARKIFDGMRNRAVVAWTAIILGYAQNGDGETALQLFSLMLLEGCSPDRAVFLVALKGCSSLAAGEAAKDQEKKIKALKQGARVHREAAKRGYESDSFVANALVDMYAKCSSMADARRVFDRFPGRTCVSWTSIILGYAQNGDGEEALLLFAEMQCEGYPPDSAAFVAALQACRTLAEREDPTEVDADQVKVKALEKAWWICTRSAGAW